MKLKSETYEEYSDLTPTDRTISSLTMAAEVLAASNLSVISPGNEPWEVKVDIESVRRSVSISRDKHMRARSGVSKVRIGRLRELIEKHREAVASGDKVTAAKARFALRQYISGKTKKTRKVSTSEKITRQKQL
jgi:hypothetical protein